MPGPRVARALCSVVPEMNTRKMSFPRVEHTSTQILHSDLRKVRKKNSGWSAVAPAHSQSGRYAFFFQYSHMCVVDGTSRKTDGAPAFFFLSGTGCFASGAYMPKAALSPIYSTFVYPCRRSKHKLLIPTF